MMRNKLFVLAASVALYTTPPANAQELGKISFPTSGSAAAQPEFVRGMLFLHSFEYASAAESFRRAQAADPRFAMAFWAEALTYTHQVWNEQDVDKARAALARLAATRDARIALARTRRESAYGTAVETLYGDGSKARRDTLYAAVLEQITREWPDDDEAQVLYATALFGLTQGVRHVPTYLRAGAIAEGVFRRNPSHPGAAHMVIHAYDDPEHAQLGLHAAREYSKIAPAAAHAQHMTTHIFLALGMWNDVVSQNVIAAGPDSSKWQPGHYTAWLLYAYLQQGRYETARMLLTSLAAHADGRPPARGPLANFRARYVMETERWHSPEAFALDADAGVSGEDGYEYATFAAGFAAARRGHGERAAVLLENLARQNGAKTSTIEPGATGAEVVPVILELSLRAEIMRQRNNLDYAVSLLAKASALEGGMPVEFGPPAVLAPTHELLGTVLIAAGRTSDAAAQFTRALELQPGRSRALLGSARAEAALGRPVAATRAYRLLAENWRDADKGVVGLAEARAKAGVR